jgi:hypothetical protein
MEMETMVSRDAVLSTLLELKGELQQKYAVQEIGVFGSVARGDAGEDSDVDVLVELSQPMGLFKFLELEEYLEARLGRKVDLVLKKALKPRIGARILEEVVTV